jgi:hypothetical protein
MSTIITRVGDVFAVTPAVNDLTTGSMVATVGPYRTGKSTLANMLARKDIMSVGRSVQRETIGLWASNAVDIGCGEPTVVIDTEGLNAPESTTAIDTNLFALSIVAARVVVYNVTKTIDTNALNQLRIACGVSKMLSPGENNQIRPALVVVVRDFELELTSSTGNVMTSTQYLEESFNKFVDVEAIVAIRSLFTTISCCVLPPPTSVDLSTLGAKHNVFGNGLRELRIQIKKSMKHSPVLPLTGVIDLLQRAVDALNDGVVPVFKSAWAAMSEAAINDVEVRFTNVLRSTWNLDAPDIEWVLCKYRDTCTASCGVVDDTTIASIVDKVLALHARSRVCAVVLEEKSDTTTLYEYEKTLVKRVVTDQTTRHVTAVHDLRVDRDQLKAQLATMTTTQECTLTEHAEEINDLEQQIEVLGKMSGSTSSADVDLLAVTMVERDELKRDVEHYRTTVDIAMTSLKSRVSNAERELATTTQELVECTAKSDSSSAKVKKQQSLLESISTELRTTKTDLSEEQKANRDQVMVLELRLAVADTKVESMVTAGNKRRRRDDRFADLAQSHTTSQLESTKARLALAETELARIRSECAELRRSNLVLQIEQ